MPNIAWERRIWGISSTWTTWTGKFLLSLSKMVDSPSLNSPIGSDSASRPATAACAHWRAPARSAGTAHSSTALGLTFEALVFVTMRAADRDTIEAFEQAVAAIPHVLQAQRLFGDPDYLLRVITRDLPGFQTLYDESLAALPGVQRLSSTLVMKSVADNRPLPL